MRKEALLWEKIGEDRVHCRLCAHHCKIGEGSFGVCGMRQNIGGTLYTCAYGSVIANHVDPIEKKPLYHFLPATLAYSIATIGCNFRCGFCQNWSISQARAVNGDSEGYEMKPEEIVREALRSGCRSIAYTYTEPTIFFEYAYDTAKLAKEKGLHNTFVTNGFMTEEAIEKIKPYLDAANIDLKYFDDELYKKVCKARLEPVLESIRNMKRCGIWVEVTTLIVPGENDSDDELRGIADFLAGLDRDTPWHISRFHPDYKYTDSRATPLETMEKAVNIGRGAGLRYIYMGNIYSRGETICPGCGKVLIERASFTANIIEKGFLDKGKCPKCSTAIAGVWK